MDPMTQSAQISSSQGFADGQNSAAKESKQSGKKMLIIIFASLMLILTNVLP